MPRPRTSHSCPQKGIRDRPASAAASAHVKLTGGATRDRQLLADANPGLGREETSRRTRTARGLGGACLPKGLHWKGERVAPRNPRTRSNFAPPMRARVPRSIFSGPPLLLQLEEMTGKSREVWGEVGGAPHASAACKRREVEGGILDNVTPSTPNREPIWPRPLPSRYWLRGPHMGGAPVRLGRAGGGEEEEGAGGQ